MKLTRPGNLVNLVSYLMVERLDGTPLALNFLNELVFRLDAFLRLVIPDDGTYVVRMEDINRRGGENFAYNLLVRLDPAP